MTIEKLYEKIKTGLMAEVEIAEITKTDLSNLLIYSESKHLAIQVGATLTNIKDEEIILE